MVCRYCWRFQPSGCGGRSGVVPIGDPLRRAIACILIVLAVALVANAWPSSQPAFSSYDDRLGYRPYQALIDDVRAKGGLVFWSMTEARDFQ